MISRDYAIALSASIEEVNEEVQQAKNKFSQAFNSLHEGFSVMKEEVDELWDEVKMKEPNKKLIREEAKQVAAMALRIMVELTPSS